MSLPFKQAIDDILAKDMDRKEFLTHIGVAGLSLIGVSGLIRSLTETGRAGHGFGVGVYGGGHKRGF